MTNLYDSEQVTIRQVLGRVMEGKAASPQSAKRVAKEMCERLYDAGFVADVAMNIGRHRVTGELMWIPEVTIMDRVEHETEHDYDQHQHEVIRNVAGVDQPEISKKASPPVAMPGQGTLWTPGQQ